MLRIIVGIFCSLMVAQVASAQPIIWKLHSQVKVLNHSVDEPVNGYILALDKYRKVANRWLPAEFKSLNGQLTHYTLELPRHYTSEQVFAFYRNQLPTSANELFACQQRQCAESNNWANDHFNVKQLYGQNASQYYGVFEMTRPAGVSYITIYSIRRGNRRLYVQLEELQVSPGELQ